MRFLCVAGSRGERAKIAPIAGLLELEHYVVLAHVTVAGNVPTWDTSAPPADDLRLEVGDPTPALRAGAVMRWIEGALHEHLPDVVLTCGDSDVAIGAMMAGALAGVAMAHLDAGVVVDRAAPHSRVVDQAATFLIAPHALAAQRLAALGMEDATRMCGDSLADAAAFVDRPPLVAGRYGLCYLNGAALQPRSLPAVVAALEALEMPALCPVGDRARELLGGGDASVKDVTVISPLDYADMRAAIAHAEVVITDCATVQREAYFRGTPVVALAPGDCPDGESSGWIRPSALDVESLIAAARQPPPSAPPHLETHRGAAGRAVQFVTSL